MKNNFQSSDVIVTLGGASIQHPFSIHSASIGTTRKPGGWQYIFSFLLVLAMSIGNVWGTNPADTVTVHSPGKITGTNLVSAYGRNYEVFFSDNASLTQLLVGSNTSTTTQATGENKWCCVGASCGNTSNSISTAFTIGEFTCNVKTSNHKALRVQSTAQTAKVITMVVSGYDSIATLDKDEVQLYAEIWDATKEQYGTQSKLTAAKTKSASPHNKRAYVLDASKRYRLTIAYGTSGSINKTLYGFSLCIPAPSCTAPAAPTISGSASYTEGETITLTGTSSDAVSTTTYAWYEGADWATASAADPVQTAATAAAGGNVFSKTAALSDDGKKYWCEAANSTCKSHNETGFEISVAAAPVANPTISSAVNEAGWGSVSDGNEGTSITVTSGSTISISSNVLTCDAKTLTATPTAASVEYTYAFDSWSGVNNGDEVTTNVTATANFTRTANSYALAWNSNGGSELTGDYTSGSTAYGTSITKPAKPTRDGYKFLGWAESASGDVVEVPATMPAAAKTYYAKWQEIVCIGNEGGTLFSADAITTSNVKKGNGTTEITSSEATVTGGTLYAVSGQSDEVQFLTSAGRFYMNNNDTRFKLELDCALRAGDTIKIDGQGGTKNSDSKGLWVSTATSRPSSAPAAVGTNSSDSWHTPILSYVVTSSDEYVGQKTIYIYRAVGSGTIFDNVRIIRPAKYALTFDAGDGEGTMASVYYFKNTEVTLPECTFTAPENKEFNAWSVAKTAGGDIEVSAGKFTMPAEAVTATATWREIATKYTVTYVLNGPTGDAPEETDKAEGAEFTLASEPSWSGHVFQGWKWTDNSSVDHVEEAEAAFTMPAYAVTFTAQWKLENNAAFGNKIDFVDAEVDLSSLFTSSSDGEVTYALKVASETASISGATFTATAAGEYVVVATQATTSTYVAAEKEATIEVLASEVEDIFIFKKDAGYGGDGKCLTAVQANTDDGAHQYTSTAYEGFAAMGRATTDNTECTLTFSVKAAYSSALAIKSICTYGKLEEPNGAQISWDGGTTWENLAKYSDAKKEFDAPGTFPTSFKIKFLGVSKSSGGLWWRNALVTLEKKKAITNTAIDLTAVKINNVAISAANLATLKTASAYALNIEDEYVTAPTVKFNKQTVITYEDDSEFESNVEIPVVATVNAGGKWEAQAEINDITYTVTMAKADAFVVNYYEADGETLIGSENVAVNGNPTGTGIAPEARDYQESYWTLNSEEVALNTITSDEAGTTIDLVAAYRIVYAESINIEQWILDNRKNNTAFRAVLTAKHYQYSDLNDLDSLTTAADRNEPYLGQKIKKTGGYISFLLEAGSEMHVKFGNIPAAVNLIVGDADPVAKSASFDYTAGESDEVIKLATTTDGTVVFKQIMIGEAIADVTLPWKVTYNAGSNGTCATASAVWKGSALTLPSVTPNTNYIFDGWSDGVTTYAAGASYNPTANVTLVAQYSMEHDNRLASLEFNNEAVAGFSSDNGIYYTTVPYSATLPKVTGATLIDSEAEYTIQDAAWDGELGYYIAQVYVTPVAGDVKYYQVRYTMDPKIGVSLIAASLTSATAATYDGLYPDKDNSAINLSGADSGKSGYKFSGSGKYIKLTLAGATYAEGDVLWLTISAEAGGGALKLYTEANNESSAIASTNKASSYIALPAAASGLSTIYVSRTSDNGYNAHITAAKITRVMNSFIDTLQVGDAIATIDEEANPKTITLQVPYSTNITSLSPTIKAWANGGATVSPSTAQDFSAGAVDYTVSSIYGETTTYAVTISKAEASHDATLSALSVAGYNIGFEASKLTYKVELPKGSVIGDLPAVSYTLNHVGATAVKTDATVLPGSTTIVVTAEDGLDANKKTYTINFTVGTMDKYVIFSGQTDALEAVPVSPSGLNWVKNSDAEDKFKFVEYAYVAGYTNAIATGGSSKSNRNIAVTIPADYEVVFEIAQASNKNGEARRAYVGAANNTSYADALFSVESSSQTDGQKAKSDALAGGKTYYIHSDNSINILELNIYLDRVSETPAISAEPADMSVCEYGTDELSVTAAVSEGTLSYQWYKEVEGDDDEAVGTNSATYTPEAAGTYYVIITNTEGEYKPNSVTSEKATVTDQTVTIITDYANAKGDVDAEKTLSVTAEGENLTYQWQACDAEGVVSVETILSTTASLDVTISADPQYYKVTVHGDCGDDQVQILKAEKWMNVEQANVTGTITWDWTSTTAGWPTASNSHIDFENTSVEYLLANVSSQVPNNDNFRSDMLIGKGQYVWRNKSEGEYGFQGFMLKFHTEVAGLVRIYYRAPSSGQTSVVIIDGNSAGSRGNSWGWSEYVKVEADRDIEIVLTNGETGMTRVQKIEFYELGGTSSEISGETDASTITPGADVTVEDGATLTVDAAKVLNDLTVKKGGKVVLSNKELTVLGTFSIETTMASGESGQLSGATTTNFAAEDAYIDITLGDNANPEKWHAFTVPFPVDALNGVYSTADVQLGNEVDYAIMNYHGDIRANGKYGWKKYRGILVPGTFYIMTVNGDIQTFRFKKVAGAAIVANKKKAYTAYDGEGADSDKGWNGIGNPNLYYGKIAKAVQVLDPESYTYVTMTSNSTNFVVGTPFFYQASEDGDIEIKAGDATAYYAPARTKAVEIKDMEVRFGNEVFTDKLYISANEDALNTYEIGKDLVKMTMTSAPKVAQIFGNAYNTKLCMVSTPLVNDNAEVALTLYAPATGEYTISVPAVEGYQVYLVREGAIIWNLSDDAYTAEFVKGNNEGYAIRVVKAPQVATDFDNIYGNTSGVQKVVIDNNVFILRGEKMFDVTGKMVK